MLIELLKHRMDTHKHIHSPEGERLNIDFFNNLFLKLNFRNLLIFNQGNKNMNRLIIRVL